MHLLAKAQALPAATQDLHRKPKDDIEMPRRNDLKHRRPGELLGGRHARRHSRHPGVLAVGWFVVLAGLVPPSVAQSTYFVETGKTIVRLGAQGRNYYAGFAEPPSQNCLYGNIYIASDNKGLYVQLLAAKLSNKRLSRVDYSQPAGAGTQCNAELVEIAD